MSNEVAQLWYTVFIQIDAHPLSSSVSWHTKIGEIDDFCIKMHGFEVRFWVYNYAPTPCFAHAQCATIRMNTVVHSRKPQLSSHYNVAEVGDQGFLREWTVTVNRWWGWAASESALWEMTFQPRADSSLDGRATTAPPSGHVSSARCCSAPLQIQATCDRPTRWGKHGLIFSVLNMVNPWVHHTSVLWNLALTLENTIMIPWACAIGPPWDRNNCHFKSCISHDINLHEIDFNLANCQLCLRECVTLKGGKQLFGIFSLGYLIINWNICFS